MTEMLTFSESEAMAVSVKRQGYPSSWVKMEQGRFQGADDSWFDLGRVLKGRVAVKAIVAIKRG